MLVGNLYDLAPGPRSFLHPGVSISGALHALGLGHRGRVPGVEAGRGARAVGRRGRVVPPVPRAAAAAGSRRRARAASSPRRSPRSSAGAGLGGDGVEVRLRLPRRRADGRATSSGATLHGDRGRARAARPARARARRAPAGRRRRAAARVAAAVAGRDVPARRCSRPRRVLLAPARPPPGARPPGGRGGRDRRAARLLPRAVAPGRGLAARRPGERPRRLAVVGDGDRAGAAGRAGGVRLPRRAPTTSPAGRCGCGRSRRCSCSSRRWGRSPPTRSRGSRCRSRCSPCSGSASAVRGAAAVAAARPARRARARSIASTSSAPPSTLGRQPFFLRTASTRRCAGSSGAAARRRAGADLHRAAGAGLDGAGDVGRRGVVDAGLRRARARRRAAVLRARWGARRRRRSCAAPARASCSRTATGARTSDAARGRVTGPPRRFGCATVWQVRDDRARGGRRVVTVRAPRFPAIDSVRAIAALSVLAYHLAIRLRLVRGGRAVALRRPAQHRRGDLLRHLRLRALPAVGRRRAGGEPLPPRCRTRRGACSGSCPRTGSR